MNDKDYFGSYELSQTTLNSLKEIDNLLDNDNLANVAWSVINPKRETKRDLDDGVEQKVERKIDDDADTVPVESSSTQFFFSQKDRSLLPLKLNKEEIVPQWQDVAESLFECVENISDRLPVVYLKSLTDDQAESAIKYLSEKLSLKGTYNLCHSICSLEDEHSIRFVRITCNNLLLPKIIDLEEPSRLMSNVIHELVEKFPEDVREFIFMPMLNIQIRDTSVFSVIVDRYPSSQKNDLILSFLTIVQELKDWHVSILSQLITTTLSDHVAKDKLLSLMSEKATTYSRDKKFGKFVLSYIKLNNPFTDRQKSMLTEIVAVNETIFKKVTESLLTNMYLYGDFWHIA
ncbi:uncharacterized protein [Venturia canescens]|uniref:uncharacterized protein n=1 Tax=Venturia canescens TaxID=32260 RepID=UPI001C9D6594|nr:uncharacterized protein LOC122412565 [Venturia canescens]